MVPLGANVGTSFSGCGYTVVIPSSIGGGSSESCARDSRNAAGVVLVVEATEKLYFKQGILCVFQ